MKRLDPNLLLAVSTGIPLILLLMTAAFYGEPGQTVKYLILTVVCAGLVVALNGRFARMMNRPEPLPMIRAEAPTTAVWAGLFPLAMIAAAALPVFFTGHDYGLLIIIASVWFGLTVDSAARARHSG